MPVFRITNSCVVIGQITQNVFHIASDSFAGLPQTVAETIRDQWLNLIRPFQHTGAKWIDIEVRDVSNIGNVPFHLAVNLLGTGSTVNVADGPVMCRVLKFQTALAGRKGRGRMYIPGTSNQAWENGVLNAASLNAGNNFIAQLKSGWVGDNASSGFNLVICPRSAPSQFKEVIDIIQRPVAGYQRRRNVGVGV